MCKTLQSTEEERTAKARREWLSPGTRTVMQHNPEVDFGKARLLRRSLVGCGSGSGNEKLWLEATARTVTASWEPSGPTGSSLKWLVTRRCINWN